MNWTRREFCEARAQRRASASSRALARSSSLALACLLASGPVGIPLQAQQPIPPDQLDPARDASRLAAWVQHRQLTEEYIWAQTDREPQGAQDQEPGASKWVFRRAFTLSSVPRTSTLYVAASGDIEVWLNGSRLLDYNDDQSARAIYTVHAMDPGSALHAGANVLVLCVSRLHAAHHTTTDPLTLKFVGGRALAVKLVPAARGLDETPLVISDGSWHGRAIDAAAVHANDLEAISSDGYDSSAWPAATLLGTLESNIAFFQWNADAGMYAWPGYVGASPYLRHFALQAVKATGVYTGSATLDGLDRLTNPQADDTGAFQVHLSPLSATESSPALTLDFGLELAGRIHLRSASAEPALVSVAYGESEEEALNEPFLGAQSIYVPPHGEAWGPKSGFRYVRIRFLSDARLSAIDVDGITYPVEYKGAFDSPDALVDRIWQTGAYTAHLCMQDGVWDGIKRDRARWAGDLDVTGRVIGDVFADRALVEDTYARLLDETQGTRPVNGIAGYSALWVSGVADFYRNTGDRAFLDRIRPEMLALLRTMDNDIGPDGLFAPKPGEHVFVDWSPGLSADTPEARRATALEFLHAYGDAAWLFGELGDSAESARLKARYEALRAKMRAALMNPATHAFGSTWQTNAMAVLSGAAVPQDYPALWANVFSNIDDVTLSGPSITPYYGFYVLEAIAQLGHRDKALNWIRDFWGGMIAEDATSFWESYDPRWTKQNFHSGLQADGLAGYYVSLAHGWSSGPTAWLSEQVLGIRATGAGFRSVTIQPDLAGLPWVEGSVPTPSGIIHLRAESGKIALDLPSGIDATVRIPARSSCVVTVDGSKFETRPSGAGTAAITIDSSGHHQIQWCFPSPTQQR